MTDTYSSRLPMDEDEMQLQDIETLSSRGRTAERGHYGRRRSKSPMSDRSPSPDSRKIVHRRRKESPGPVRATARHEMTEREEREWEDRMMRAGPAIVLPTGGPLGRSPSTTSVSTTSSTTSLSDEYKGGKKLRKERQKHQKGFMPPMGARVIDLDTRTTRGKKKETLHYISFGRLHVRLVRGKNLPKNTVSEVKLFLPTPSIKKKYYGKKFGKSHKAKRIENYAWDEEFSTPVELEVNEDPREVVRNLVAYLEVRSPHLHRELGDLEGTIDLSDMLRSPTPLQSHVKLPLYPVGHHKKRREERMDTKYRPKLYLELRWRPNEAFSHSYRSLLYESEPNLRGLKSRIYRLNVSGFSKQGTTYGLIWLQSVAHSWVDRMGGAIQVMNLTSGVQPGPFDWKGHFSIWEAIVTIWYTINEDVLRRRAEREGEIEERRSMMLSQKAQRDMERFGQTEYDRSYEQGGGQTGTSGYTGDVPIRERDRRREELDRPLQQEREIMSGVDERPSVLMNRLQTTQTSGASQGMERAEEGESQGMGMGQGQGQGQGAGVGQSQATGQGAMETGLDPRDVTREDTY